jgi:hypothetical protein
LLPRIAASAGILTWTAGEAVAEKEAEATEAALDVSSQKRVVNKITSHKFPRQLGSKSQQVLLAVLSMLQTPTFEFFSVQKCWDASSLGGNAITPLGGNAVTPLGGNFSFENLGSYQY